MRPLESVLTGLKNTSPVRHRFLCHLLGLLLLLPGRVPFRNLRRYSAYHGCDRSIPKTYAACCSG